MVAGNDEGIKWETLDVRYDEDIYEHFSRCKVEGGHLYRSFVRWKHQPTLSMNFVPDVDLSRYQAHLRDAYRQGYNDGQSDAKVGCRADLEL